MIFFRHIVTPVILILTGSLLSCSSDPGSSEPYFKLSTNRIDVGIITNSGQGADQKISGTVTNYDGPLYVYITHTNNGISSISTPTLSGNRGTSTITMQPKTQGVYFDVVSVQACRDAMCNNELPGSPQFVKVTYTVGIAVDPPSLSFFAVAGSPPPSQTVTVFYDPASSGKNWSSSFLYLDGSGWMTYDPADNPSNGKNRVEVEVTLDAFPSGTMPGVYNAEIRFGANAGGTTVTLPVQYTIN